MSGLKSIIADMAGGYDAYTAGAPAPTGTLNLKRAVVVCDGNSLTQGGYGSPVSNYPDIMAFTTLFRNKSMQVVNFGVGGQQTSQMITDAAAQIDILLSDAHENILVFWEVGNDLFYNQDVTAAINRAKDYLLARKTAGWKTVVLTCPPRDLTITGSSGAFNTEWNANALLANEELRDLSSTYMDALCDVALDSRLSTVNFTYYHTDGIHFISAGNTVVADLVSQTIQTI